MREIKFRYIYQHKEAPFEIADTRDSIWNLEQIAEGEPINYIDVCLSSSWNIIEINQYTGLKDKNGKEIFEGDVIKNNKGKIYKILFLYGAFYAYSIKIEIDRKKGKSLYLLEDISNSSEIIGNIYENPELLNS